MGKRPIKPRLRSENVGKTAVLPSHRHARGYLTKGDRVVYYGQVGTIVKIRRRQGWRRGGGAQGLVRYDHRDYRGQTARWLRLVDLHPLPRGI